MVEILLVIGSWSYWIRREAFAIYGAKVKEQLLKLRKILLVAETL